MLKRILKLSACALLIISMMIGVMACSPAPSEDKFKDAQKASVNNFLAQLDTVTNNQTNLEDMSSNISLSVELSDEIISMLSSTAEVDMSFIKGLEIALSQSTKNDITSIGLALKNQGSEIISANGIADMNANTIYLSVPALSNQSLKFDLNEMMGDVGMDMGTAIGGANMVSTASSALLANLPDAEVVKKIVGKYFGLIIDSLDDIEYDKKGDISIGDIEENCIVYTATMSRKDIYDLTITVLEAAKADTDLKDFAISLASFYISQGVDGTADEAYGEVIDAIDDAIAQIKYAKEAEEEPKAKALVWKSYMTKDNEVLATSIKFIGGEDEDENTSIFWGKLEKKNDVAVEAWAKVGGEKVFEISGELEKDGNLISGTYDISAQGTKLLYVDIKKLDTEKLDAGLLDGAIILSPAKGIAELLPDMGGISLSSISLRFDIKQTSNSADLKISLLNNNAPYIAVNLKTSLGAGVATSIPSNTTTDAEAWAGSLDLIGFSSKLSQSGIPADIINAIASAIEDAFSPEDYYEQYYIGWDDGYSNGYMDFLFGSSYNDYSYGSQGYMDGYAEGYQAGWYDAEWYEVETTEPPYYYGVGDDYFTCEIYYVDIDADGEDELVIEYDDTVYTGYYEIDENNDGDVDVIADTYICDFDGDGYYDEVVYFYGNGMYDPYGDDAYDRDFDGIYDLFIDMN